MEVKPGSKDSSFAFISQCELSSSKMKINDPENFCPHIFRYLSKIFTVQILDAKYSC